MKSLKKGFTLVELMVVIVIIGILAALAIPRFLGATNKTKATEFKPVLKQIYTLQMAYKQEKDLYAPSLNLVSFDQPDTATSRFTYTSTTTAAGAAGTNGMLGMATVKAGPGGAVLIKGVDGASLTGKKACVDTSALQYADVALANISNSLTSQACP
ncbi:MAG TPA: type II secretion system protein [Fibrobacteria bacterium]|nr:type II secretion system protein [Fibrobacteria bacterium]